MKTLKNPSFITLPFADSPQPDRLCGFRGYFFMNKKIKNIAGQKFGRLLVLSFAGSNSDHKAQWNCLCDCGNNAIVSGKHMRKGNTVSCGCVKHETDHSRFLSHGESSSIEYKTWLSMKRRCYRINSKDYKYYGGRGITMSDEWKNNFMQFLSDMGRRPKGLTIERINNELGYSKENCKWATWSDQVKNRRNLKNQN